MTNLARLKTRLSRHGGASLFYVGILIIACLNISSVHFSSGFRCVCSCVCLCVFECICSCVHLTPRSRLEASVHKAGLRRARSLFGRSHFGSSGITVSARKYMGSRSRFPTVGQTGAELAAESAADNATLTAYWELQIKNGRDNQLYVDLAIDSTAGPPRDPRTKEVQLGGADSSRRQVEVDGRTHAVVRRWAASELSCTHAHTHARTHARTHKRTHEHTNTQTHARTHTRTHARAHTPTHSLTLSLTHACTHARMHALACARAHTHRPLL